MKKVKQLLAMLALTSFLVMGCDKDDDDYNNQPQIQSTVISGAGDSATVAGKFSQFRVVVGDPLNSTPGQAAGRREVNWDGVPVNFTNNSSFPLDFFNNTDAAGPNGRKRGLQYLNNGTQIRVDSTDFSEIDASYAAEFESFSRKKLIIPVNSNITEIQFKIPGTVTDATVNGFGLVFSDVDDPASTYVEFFNGSKSLGVFKAPAAAGSQKFSFLGVHFPSERITRVRITAGNAALAPGVKDITSGGSKDLVTIDDFIYSEPVVE